MSEKIYSVFLNENYYHNFIALFNSYKYYGNKVPLRVYSIDPNPLNASFRNIEKHCEIIDVTRYKGVMSHSVFYGKMLFKFVALLNEMKDNEIILDADTLFLSNLDFLFDVLPEGFVLGASEVAPFHTIRHNAHYTCPSDEWTRVNGFISSKLRLYLGEDVANRYHDEYVTPVLNGGFLGFNKVHHSYLFEKCIDILTDEAFESIDFLIKNPVFANEQYMLSFLISLYNQKIHVLPHETWMNTWSAHGNPRKLIYSEGGRLHLMDEFRNKINFYHFTGGIYLNDENGNDVHHVRTHNLYEPTSHVDRVRVEKLWYEKFENPVLLLYEYFHDKGL
jgi:lipopolysaccharide biosynthesis glycosyltransferase